MNEKNVKTDAYAVCPVCGGSGGGKYGLFCKECAGMGIGRHLGGRFF